MRFSLLMAVTSMAAFAQTPLSLEDAVSRALSHHPLLEAGAEKVAASAALQSQARMRPNPRAYFQTENLRSGGTPAFSFSNEADTFGYFSQLVETAGKRDRRIEVAGAASRRTGLERELLGRQIAQRVKLAYWNAASAQKVRELLEENAATFRQIVEFHEARVKEGAMAEADLLRVRLEGERLEITANTAALEAERARIELFREMGESEFPEVRFADGLESTGLDIPADVNRALVERTEVKLARAALEQAKANAGLQRAMSKPDVDFVFGYKRTTGFNTVLGGLQMELPLMNRNQGNIMASDRGIRAARAEVAAQEALVRAEVLAAKRDYDLRRKQAEMLLPALRDHAAESSKIALAAYREGGADLLRLLDSERLRIETQLLYYRAMAELRQSEVALETAMGVDR
jgi:cobalt-zinc-cadmium efflux system outer membrane protein